MKAAIYDRYGPADVVRIAEIATPEPGPGEILVRIRATTVTTADWRLRAAAFPAYAAVPGRLMFGLFRPRKPVLGGEFAGEVAALGAGVTNFAVGDRVFGFAVNGAHAEYRTIRADAAVARIPEGLGDTDAAAVPFGALAALVFLRDFAGVQPGERVLIAGASGGVGVFAVQIARAMGAHVTALASGARADLLQSLGAHGTIDYIRSDVTRDRDAYDVILDTAGVFGFREIRETLRPGGRFVPLEARFGDILRSLRPRGWRGRRVVFGISGDRQADLEEIAGHLAEGSLRPVIDRILPFAEIRAAYTRVESRHKTGSVVLSLGSDTAGAAAA